MKQIKIPELEILLESKKITLKEAARRIWADIYLNPVKYGLDEFNEDERSDFLMEFQGKLPLILSKYDRTKSTLSTFLTACIRYRKRGWIKRKNKKDTELETSLSYLYVDFINKTFEQSVLPFENITSDIDSKKIVFTNEGSECRKKINVFTALVLLLKACRDVDDRMISKISQFTDIEEKKLQNLVQEMRNAVLKANIYAEKLCTTRDNAFFFRKKYGLEISQNRISSLSYDALKKKYDYQTEIWEKANSYLQKSELRSPSNIEIGEKLKLPPRTVGFYLFHARKNLEKVRAVKKEEDKGIYKNPPEGN